MNARMQDKETRRQGDKGMKTTGCSGMSETPTRNGRGFLPLSPCLLVSLSLLAMGCRQKMSDQPYHRPLEASEFYPLDRDAPAEMVIPANRDGRASRPLERGVIHRGQFLESDPHVTGLTREEWGRAYAQLANPKIDYGLNPDQLQEANRKI